MKRIIWINCLWALGFFSLLRLGQSLFSLPNASLITAWSDSHHPINDALITILVTAFWLSVGTLTWFFAIKKNYAIAGELPIIAFFLSGIGLGILLRLCFYFPVYLKVPDSLFLMCPFILVTFVMVSRSFGVKLLAPMDTGNHRSNNFFLMTLIIIIGLYQLFWLLDSLVYLAFLRPAASGDEAHYWWSSTNQMIRSGFYDYMKSFSMSNYTPGYPLIGVFLIGWIPTELFPAAARSLPFLYGFSMLWFLISRPLQYKSYGQISTGFYLLFGYALLFQHSWLHDMFFSLWYGEAMATMVFVILLMLLYNVKVCSRFQWQAFLGLFGLGVISVMTKPPLSILLLPAILPTIAAFGVFLSGPDQSNSKFLWGVFFAFLGGALSQYCWSSVLSSVNKEAIYSPGIQEILSFNFAGSLSQLVPYFFANYKTVWVFFLLTTIMAFCLDWRKFFPFWLVCFGMIISVFVLYGGVWSHVEHESGARYIMHGAYGWVLFSLYAMYPHIQETLDRPSGASRRLLPSLTFASKPQKN